MHRSILLAALVAAVLPASPLAAQSAVRDNRNVAIAAPHAPAPSFVLGPGDAVRVTVWRQPEFSGEFVIAADGSITHPLYRSIVVTGLGLPDVEDRLRRFLQRFDADPQFVVEPLVRISVSGEVNRPNLLSLRPETLIPQAIALAGGPTDRARRDRVQVMRGNERLVLDLSRADAAGVRMPVRSGDQIMVERRHAVFREVILPVVSMAGASAAILNVILRNR